MKCKIIRWYCRRERFGCLGIGFCNERLLSFSLAYPCAFLLL